MESQIINPAPHHLLPALREPVEFRAPWPDHELLRAPWAAWESEQLRA